MEAGIPPKMNDDVVLPIVLRNLIRASRELETRKEANVNFVRKLVSIWRVQEGRLGRLPFDLDESSSSSSRCALKLLHYFTVIGWRTHQFMEWNCKASEELRNDLRGDNGCYPTESPRSAWSRILQEVRRMFKASDGFANSVIDDYPFKKDGEEGEVEEAIRKVDTLQEHHRWLLNVIKAARALRNAAQGFMRESRMAGDALQYDLDEPHQGAYPGITHIRQIRAFD